MLYKEVDEYLADVFVPNFMKDVSLALIKICRDEGTIHTLRLCEIQFQRNIMID